MRLAVMCTLTMVLACGQAAAQDAQACPGAWPPCGADRVFAAQELAQRLLHPAEVTRIDMTGGTSGRKFVLLLRPEGKLEMTMGGGGNFGRDWKLEDNKLCLRAYRNVWGGQFNCGVLEVQGGAASWHEAVDGSRNRIDAVSFVQP